MAFPSARLGFSRLPKFFTKHKLCAFRNIGTSAGLNAKRIVEREEDNITVIRGEFVESPHAGNVISSAEPGCPLCRLGVHNVTHDDVLILSQFMDKEGSMLPQKVSLRGELQLDTAGLAIYSDCAHIRQDILLLNVDHWTLQSETSSSFLGALQVSENRAHQNRETRTEGKVSRPLDQCWQYFIGM